jgi:tRNA dimethylallyltransferase
LKRISAAQFEEIKVKVVFVVGPTASGKSELALRLALKLGGVIVNCDSVQCYEYLDIGSAKPSKQEMAQVPHYLFSFVQPITQLTAGEYSRKALETLAQLKQKDTPYVFVVGGTGFYFQALEKGLYPILPRDESLTKEIENELAQPGGAEKLFEELKTKDSVSAQKIKPQDHFRLVRALEFIRSSNKKWSDVRNDFEEQKTQESFPYPLKKIGIWAERAVLEPRVRMRTERMLKCGWVEEVESLIAKGWGDWPALNSVGYSEIKNYLQTSEFSNAELIEQISTATLQLSKKQRTWFKRDPSILWSSEPAIEQQIAVFLKSLDL